MNIIYMVRQGQLESERVPLLCLAGPSPVRATMDYKVTFPEIMPAVSPIDEPQ